MFVYVKASEVFHVNDRWLGGYNLVRNVSRGYVVVNHLQYGCTQQFVVQIKIVTDKTDSIVNIGVLEVGAEMR